MPSAADGLPTRHKTLSNQGSVLARLYMHGMAKIDEQYTNKLTSSSNTQYWSVGVSSWSEIRDFSSETPKAGGLKTDQTVSLLKLRYEQDREKSRQEAWIMHPSTSK